MISVSLSQEKDPRKHTHFKTQNPLSLDQFAELVCASVWSPIIWKDGVRRGENFLSAKYAGLDFDDGQWDLDEARAFFESSGVNYLLGTTKSHRLNKNGLVADRFRVILPFENIITDPQLYCYNMWSLSQDLPIDPACKDAGRFFYPCKEIVSHKNRPGAQLKVRQKPKESVKPKEPMNQKNHGFNLNQRIIPAFVLTLLRSSTERHNDALKVGRILAKRGFELDEILHLVRQSPLILAGEEDIIRTTKNGAEYGYRLRAEWLGKKRE